MPKQENDSKQDPEAKSSEPKENTVASDATASPAQSSGKPTAEASPPTDAIALLKEDHRRAEKLFSLYQTTSDEPGKAKLIEQICDELIIHTSIEEDIFYPSCRRANLGDTSLNEAQVEHDSAKVLILELMRDRSDDHYRDAKVKVLAEQIKHHVAEEEQPGSGLFAKAQAAGLNTPALAARLQSRKQALQSDSDRLRPSRSLSFQVRSQINSSPQMEDKMARQGTPERDEYGRFTSDEDHRGSGRNGERNASRGRYEEDDRSHGSRGRDDERGWYGDPEGHSEASRRGWSARGGEQRSFARHNDDDHERSIYGREHDERGRFTDENDYRYGSRSGTAGRERDERGRFMSDDDRGGYGSNRNDRDERGRFTGEDDRYSARGRHSEHDRDDERRYGAGGRENEGRGWYGDPRGHSEASRRGWEERARSASSSGREYDEERGYRSRDRDEDDRRSGRSGWFGDSRGHAEAARRGWEDRR